MANEIKFKSSINLDGFLESSGFAVDQYTTANLPTNAPDKSIALDIDKSLLVVFNEIGQTWTEIGATTFDASAVTSGQFDDARISETSVTQYVGGASGTIDHNSLLNFVAAEHINWAAASVGTIHPTNLAIGSNVQAYSSILDDVTAPYTSEEKTKLSKLWGGDNKLDATNNPNSDDDSANTGGNGEFLVGSVWVNITSNESYRCVDSTEANAVWVNTSLESGDLAFVAISGSADDVDDADTTNKFVNAAAVTKLSKITVTQDVNLDTIESDTATNNGKVSNVDTNLSIGNKTTTALDIISSDGNNATVPAATITEAGLMTAADKVILDNITDTDDQTAAEVTYNNTNSSLSAETVQAAIDEVEARVDANDAKVTNVDTNLDYTASPTNGIVTSSDGTDATLTLADITNAGLLAPADFTKVGHITVTQAVDLDTIESDTATNNAKVTNVDTNLDYTASPTNGIVTSSDGTDATLTLADITNAGLLTPADFTKIGHITVTQAVDLDTIESDTATNNVKVSADGSVTSHSDITDAGSGAIITIAERGEIAANTNARHSHGVYTVATLPATPAQGDSAFVTDSGNTLASHHGSVVANGGANFVPVFYDGTNWLVG